MPHGEMSSAEERTILEVRNVTRKFGAFIAVRDISIRLREGEVLGIVGPNGAGKSTLFSCLTGDLPTSSGAVLFRGRDVTRLPPEKRARIGISRSFQVPLIFADMTVLENVMVGALLRTSHTDVARARAMEITELVGLSHARGTRAGQLGTPSRKRLEIARALATGPSVLMLDEVMAGLTPVEVRDAIPIVEEIHRRGVTLIVVEHIMEVIMSVAERVMVMNHGVQVALGPPQQAMRDPAVIDAYLGKRATNRIMQAP